MKKIYFAIIIMTLTVMMFSAVIYVEPGTQYPTIHSGINAAQNGDVVRVKNGTYSGTGNINLQWSNKHISVVSQNGAANCTINLTGNGFILNNATSADLILGFTFTSSENVRAIRVNSGNPIIRNNVFDGIDGSDDWGPGTDGPCIYIASGAYPTVQGNTFRDNTGFNGGAIYVAGSAQIIDNIFESNSTHNYNSGEILYSGEGGAIYVTSNSNNTLKITGNSFISNLARNGAAAIHISDGKYVEIKNNVFDGNMFDVGGMGDINSSAVSVNDINTGDTFTMNYNTFKNSNTSSEDSCPVITLSDNTATINLNNNTFKNNNMMYCVIDEFNTNNVVVKNCIFESNSGYTHCNANFVFDYNLLYNDTVGNGCSNGSHSIVGQSPQLDTNLAPVWDNSLRSRVIDSGDPTILDADGTRSDIGGKTAFSHKYEEKTVYRRAWTWLSFPVLDRISNSTGFDGDRANVLLADILSTSFLSIMVNYNGNNGYQNIEWSAGDGWTNDTQTILSTKGYKFQTVNASANRNINCSGTLIPANTSITLRGNNDENWIGYFLEDSQIPQDAFADIWDNLTHIYTQDWTMYKVNGIWYGSSNRYTLNYGDMVVVKCVNNCTFQWNDGVPVNPTLKSTAKNFTYEEQSNYIPVFIDLDETAKDEIPSEIGMYVDGVCRGAVAVDGQIVQLNAYLEGVENTEDVEFVLFYEGEKNRNTLSEFSVLNTNTMLHENKGMTIDGSDFYAIKFGKSENNNTIPGTLKLHGNYPNPFNPITSISFSLPVNSAVTVDIYNVKGQQVTTLTASDLSAGVHSITWNGTDETGKTVGSGVYMYRLTANKQTLTGKMLMMK